MTPEAGTVDWEWMEELLERVRPRIRGILAGHGIPVQDAEDLVQEALLSVIQRREQVANPEGYLLTALNYRCLSYWYSHSREIHQAVDKDVLEELAGPQPPVQETVELRLDLVRSLARLPPQLRRLLRLRYVMGHTARELAHQLGELPERIYQRTRSARSALKRHLKEVDPKRRSKDV